MFNTRESAVNRTSTLSEGTFKQPLAQLKELLCNPATMKMTYLIVPIGIAANLTYYCAMFNVTQIKGNPIQVLIVFSLAEVIGIGLSEKLSRLMKDTNQQIINFILIALLNYLVKFVTLNETVMMVVFFVEILLIGCAYNLWLIIM
jgi:Na+/melibiose symporter-like transporter